MPLIRVDNLAGIPLFYDRYSSSSYGVSAVPMRPYIDDQFHEACVDCVQELSNVLAGSGFTITQIWSGGLPFSCFNLDLAIIIYLSQHAF